MGKHFVPLQLQLQVLTVDKLIIVDNLAELKLGLGILARGGSLARVGSLARGILVNFTTMGILIEVGFGIPIIEEGSFIVENLVEGNPVDFAFEVNNIII